MISVVGSGTTPIVWARGVASWFDAHRGFALALMLLGTGAAGVLTPLVLGGLIQNYGWKVGYLGLAVVAVVAIIPVYFLFRERELRDPEAQAMGNAIGLTVKEAAATRDFWIIVAAFRIHRAGDFRHPDPFGRHAGGVRASNAHSRLRSRDSWAPPSSSAAFRSAMRSIVFPHRSCRPSFS